MVIAVYPGSFDPVTSGHVDIAERAAALFEQLIVAIYDTPPKPLLFTTEERVALMKKALSHLPNVRVESYSGLTVGFAKKVKAKVVVRGLRMSSDFEREFEMALMNKKLAPDLELICFMTNLEYEFVSSSLLKEVSSLGGCIDGLVPDHVAVALRDKFRR
ncbi:MAG: pantetheine-phosphate adenylyltransferase [Dehalococcoidia bacterium]|nr:pantetheine-phosphate adenylyltransferase [Dehalococcoidia bacterium]